MGTRPPAFRFYEIVRVRPSHGGSGARPLADVEGLEGAILGMSESDDNGWSYAVFLLDQERVCCLDEADLEPTGRVERRETFYDDNATIRVRVDPNTGAGQVVSDPDRDDLPSPEPGPPPP